MNMLCNENNTGIIYKYQLNIGENDIYGKDFIKMKVPMDQNKSGSLILKIKINPDNGGSIQVVDQDISFDLSKLFNGYIKLCHLRCYYIHEMDDFLSIISLKFSKFCFNNSLPPILDSFNFNFKEIKMTPSKINNIYIVNRCKC